MSSDLNTYLATRYLTADPKPSKKRKRKQPGGGGGDAGLQITDDADAAWARPAGNDDDDGDDDGGAHGFAGASVAGTSAEFRKAKKSGWKVVGGAPDKNSGSGAAAPGELGPGQGGAGADADADADRILASAAAESRAAGSGSADDAPAVVTMSDGTHAGLQTAAAVSAQLEARRRAERAEFEASSGGKKHKEQETVYRDATGRRVDLAWKRAEARREADAARERDEEARRALRGDVQQRDAEARRDALVDARTMAFARTADDEEMNAELKGRARWGDTMAQFVGSGDSGGGRGGKGKKKGSVKGRPVYQGAAPPNRYGIRPGYRWDGVDRGNGFEAERFKAINRRERNKGLEYSWQMDE